MHFDEKYGYFSAYHNSKIKFTLQLQEQKSGGRVTQCSTTLCGGCCIQPKKSSPLEPFQIRYFVVHFAQNLVIYVPTTLAKQILFCNHMNRKVVGGKCNVLIHYIDPSTLNLSSVVLWNTFKWDILLCVHIHYFKSLKCVLCVSLHYEIPIGFLQD